MTDQRVARLARLLVDYSVEVQSGDRVAIVSTPAAAPLVLPVYERVLERGGHPELALSLPGIEEVYYRVASDEQLDFVSPIQRLIFEDYDVLLNIRSET
ncbi:MAG: aminopeptidase, partial [Anaerolineae bacterium]